jgi:hypothetical protein
MIIILINVCNELLMRADEATGAHEKQTGTSTSLHETG